jgi:hypothetical protein
MNRRSLIKWVGAATATRLLLPEQADKLLYEIRKPVSVIKPTIESSVLRLYDAKGSLISTLDHLGDGFYSGFVEQTSIVHPVSVLTMGERSREVCIDFPSQCLVSGDGIVITLDVA